MFKKGDKVRFTGVNPNGGEKYGKEGDVATVLVPDIGYNYTYKSNQAEVDLPGCNIDPSVPWSSLELISDSPVRQEIIPGTYDGVRVGESDGDMVRVALVDGVLTPDELERAAAVLTALAGALRDGK